MIRHRHYGFTFVELTISLSLLGLILVGLAVSLDGFRRFNHYQLTRQRCIAAAQAQLDSITITGQALEEKALKSHWPHVKTFITQSKGSNQWSSLKHIEVLAIGQSMQRKVRVRLARYIQTQYDSQGERP